MPPLPISDLPPMFCRQCGYSLIGLPSHRCPECGRDFDPTKGKTFLTRPRAVFRRRVVKRIIYAILILVGLSLPLDGYVGYLAWQVHVDKKAIQFLRDNGEVYSVAAYNTKPGWAQSIFGDHGDWLWDREGWVDIIGPNAHATEMFVAVGKLKSLRLLAMDRMSATPDNLAHLKGLTSLRGIVLKDTGITDAGLAQLKDLKALQHLILVHETQVTADGMADLDKALPNLEIRRD